ncbi:hypothetical protein [Rhizobium hidalgonense]|uniref:hypothetical protein n=1 Tax=Rhizobium hidalgonense TaxID=1538159 RepID=UPI002871C968|nr:hypothetical protein [Rhizobium hidalgonense]MDR9807372.1 hypothetical protein [Rhizobium hidalgonense]
MKAKMYCFRSGSRGREGENILQHVHLKMGKVAFLAPPPASLNVCPDPPLPRGHICRKKRKLDCPVKSREGFPNSQLVFRESHAAASRES